MKNIRFIIVTIFLLICSINTSFAQYAKDSCNLSAKDRYSSEVGSIQLGKFFTSYKIPYLNDHSIIYNSSDKKWHLFGIVRHHTSFIHLTADSLTQKAWIKECAFTDSGAEIWTLNRKLSMGEYRKGNIR